MYNAVPSAFNRGVVLYALPEDCIVLVDWNAAAGTFVPHCCVFAFICAMAGSANAAAMIAIIICFTLFFMSLIFKLKTFNYSKL